MAANLPIWVGVGTEVKAPGVDGYLTITRITATQITLSDGSKWRAKDLTQLGHPAYDPTRVYGSGVRRLRSRADVEASELSSRIGAVAQAAGRLRFVRALDDEHAEALRTAIERLAPYLGLTVTRD